VVVEPTTAPTFTNGRYAIDDPLAAKDADEERVILFNLCGHGYFALASHEGS
jgi:predicted alternative tryptophan synthase beta-subunit